MQRQFSKEEKLILGALSRVVSSKRKELEKSQRMLAFEYDMHKSLISRVENAMNEPLFFSFWKIANVLKLKPSELLLLVEQELGKNILLVEE